MAALPFTPGAVPRPALVSVLGSTAVALLACAACGPEAAAPNGEAARPGGGHSAGRRFMAPEPDTNLTAPSPTERLTAPLTPRPPSTAPSPSPSPGPAPESAADPAPRASRSAPPTAGASLCELGDPALAAEQRALCREYFGEPGRWPPRPLDGR